MITGRTCYDCEAPLSRLQGSALCPACASRWKALADATPRQPVCPSCGYHFVNDNERVQHVLVDRHHYRAHGRVT